MTIADEQEPSAEITRLLEYLRGVRGFDFTGYKLSSLLRRICKRMAEVGVAGFAEYIDFLEVSTSQIRILHYAYIRYIEASLRCSTKEARQ